LHWLLALVSLLGLTMVLSADGDYGSPLAPPMLGAWAAYAAMMLYALWMARDSEQKSVALAHLGLLWGVALALTMQLKDVVDTLQLAEGWAFVALVAPLMLMTLGLWRRQQWLAWPRAAAFPGYSIGWYALAFPMLVIVWLFGVFLEGSAAPLFYLPLLNPLEAGLIAIAALLASYLVETPPRRPLLKVWPYVGFLFVTLATLRAVHHWHGEPWGFAVLQSGFSQAALTVVWSLIGVIAMLRGSMQRNAPMWAGGGILMLVVLAKLIIVDRHYMGNIWGIVSFMVVGLLLVGVGYFAPKPPKAAEGASA